MNNIIIVEDKLKRGIAVAEQFIGLAAERPEWEIKVLAVCYFQASGKKANEEINDCGRQPFAIERMSLWNFDDVMDKYTDPKGDHAIAIIDYFLDGDASGGVPMRRVNIRYAKRADEKKKKQLWFYTATGTENQRILCELVGEAQVLEVEEVRDDFLRLDLEKEELTDALQENVLVAV